MSIQTPRAKMMKGKGAPKTCPEPKQKTTKIKLSSVKGKSRKSDGTDDNRFPYSEIKEIIAASQDSPPVKRGRGRPPKKSPATATKATPVTKKTQKKSTAETPTTSSTTSTPQGRYSTRGIRKNYVQLNSGNMSIKQEPVSESESEQEQSEEEDDTAARRTTRSSARTALKRKRVSMPPKSSSKRQKQEQEEEEDDEEEEGEDDGEVHEIDDDDDDDDVEEIEGDEIMSSLMLQDGNDEGENYLDDSEQEMEELDEDEGKIEDSVDVRDDKITDSTVKGLKTTNVSTSVPAVFKLGMRVKMPRRRNVKQSSDGADNSDDEMEKDVDESGEPVQHLKCSLCEDFTAATFADLTSHLVTFHHVYDPPRCDVCQRDFDNSTTLKLHLDRRHGPKTEPKVWKCNEEGCSKEFTSQNGLTGHVNRVHVGVTSIPKKYSCDKCSFECNSLDSILQHNRQQHDEPITCPHCDKAFMNYPSLKSHISVKHSDIEPLACDICGKLVKHPRYMQKHRESHFPPKFNCYICQKKVQSSSSLKHHLETHKPVSERTYKYMCSYCGKPFALKANYEDHLNKHTGARPYKCDICQRAFAFRSMMMKHKTFVHTVDRPYKCGNCMKGFKFMNLLRNHMITHTNKSTHVCPTCSKCFTTASTLKFHQRKCKGANPVWHKHQQPVQTPTLILDTAMGAVKVTDSVLVDHSSMLAPTAVSVETTPGLEYTAMETIEKPVEGEMLNSMGSQTAVEETVVMDTVQVAAPTEVEVYACSECNSTFGTYKEAEQHVLTAHSAPQVQMETETVHIAL